MEVVSGWAEIDDVGTFLETIGSVADEHGLTVQAFDARYVVDRNHLQRAVDLATRARERGEMIADDPGVEILLYAAGRRQINQAFEMGISTGECPVVACLVDCDEHSHSSGPTGMERQAAEEIGELLDSEETLGAYDRESVCEFFSITETELAATKGGISDLVAERVALLVVER